MSSGGFRYDDQYLQQQDQQEQQRQQQEQQAEDADQENEQNTVRGVIPPADPFAAPPEQSDGDIGPDNDDASQNTASQLPANPFVGRGPGASGGQDLDADDRDGGWASVGGKDSSLGLASKGDGGNAIGPGASNVLQEDGAGGAESEEDDDAREDTSGRGGGEAGPANPFGSRDGEETEGTSPDAADSDDDAKSTHGRHGRNIDAELLGDSGLEQPPPNRANSRTDRGRADGPERRDVARSRRDDSADDPGKRRLTQLDVSDDDPKRRVVDQGAFRVQLRIDETDELLEPADGFELPYGTFWINYNQYLDEMNNEAMPLGWRAAYGVLAALQCPSAYLEYGFRSTINAPFSIRNHFHRAFFDFTHATAPGAETTTLIVRGVTELGWAAVEGIGFGLGTAAVGRTLFRAGSEALVIAEESAVLGDRAALGAAEVDVAIVEGAPGSAAEANRQALYLAARAARRNELQELGLGGHWLERAEADEIVVHVNAEDNLEEVARSLARRQGLLLDMGELGGRSQATLVVHGSVNSEGAALGVVVTGEGESEVVMTAEQFARHVVEQGWNGERIRLISCSTGVRDSATGASFAERFAEELLRLGRPTTVIAPRANAALVRATDEVRVIAEEVPTGLGPLGPLTRPQYHSPGGGWDYIIGGYSEGGMAQRYTVRGR